MENKALKKIFICFVGEEDPQVFHDVDVNDLAFNLVNGNRQRWMDLPPHKRGPTLMGRTLVNLENVTHIVIEP